MAGLTAECWAAMTVALRADHLAAYSAASSVDCWVASSVVPLAAYLVALLAVDSVGELVVN